MNQAPLMPETPKRSGPIKPWLLIVLAVVVIAAAAYWWFGIRNSKSDSTLISATPTPTATVSASNNSSAVPSTSKSNTSAKTATPSPVPTKNWNGIISSTNLSCDLKASFSYPADFTADLSGGTAAMKYTNLRVSKNDFWLTVASANISAKQYQDPTCTSYTDLNDYRTKNGGIVSLRSFTTSNGYPAVYYNVTASAGLESATAIQNPTDKNIVTISYISNSATSDAQSAAMNIIVDSFKFK